MAKATRFTDAGREMVEVPQLPPCPPWCDNAEDDYPCWGHDLDDAWTVSHTRDLGRGVAVVQTGRWTPTLGLSTDPATGALAGDDDVLLTDREVRLLIDALRHARRLLGEINGPAPNSTLPGSTEREDDAQ